jgi:hypothetical protein
LCLLFEGTDELCDPLWWPPCVHWVAVVTGSGGDRQHTLLKLTYADALEYKKLTADENGGLSELLLLGEVPRSSLQKHDAHEIHGRFYLMHRTHKGIFCQGVMYWHATK